MLLTTLLSRTPTRASKNQSQRTTVSGRSWLQHVAELSGAEVLDELGAHPRGLAADEVDAMRSFWGENRMAHTERPALPRRVLGAFADPFTYILVVIAIVSVLTDWAFAEASQRSLTTPAIIGLMVLISGVLRFVQNERSGNAAAALAEMIETTCNVERPDAGRAEIPLDEVVVGDVVHLCSGDIVPADLRILAARDLFVSQSSLTGESAPVEKRAEATEGDAADATVTDLESLVFLGSTVISGTATGVVVATGERTLFGEAAGSLGPHAAAARQTSSDAGIAATSRLLVGLMVVMVPAVFLISGLTKGDWLAALLFSLAVAVGLTPEMLPMLVTVCLGKGAVDLSEDRVIVKRLDAISDLGAIDVLCCDKTGTLTEDRVILERHLDVQGNRDVRVLRAAFLNSFFETGVKNLIDSAIIRRALEEDEDAEELCGRYTLVDELPFDFERRRLSVVVGDEAGHTRMICKGAIEEILSVCSQVELDAIREPLTPELERTVMARAAGLSERGMRVLGVALKDDPAGADQLTTADEKDMVLVGYLAFLDPPKETAAKAVKALAEHGVSTKVLTGDSSRVAVYVCETIGIPVEGVLTGSEVEAMDDAELTRRVERTSVFAKLAPASKARVVSTLRDLGHVVGFMGDGVNDAAAMGASDCGVSVDSAVDVAREAADIILLEKDLMVLERGIVCGRRTLANMFKYVKMTVSSNFGNIISVIVAATLLPFLPMGPVQLLLLNLIYDLTCTALPWDGVDDELVRGPRVWDSSSVKSFMLWMGPVSSLFDILTFVALFFWICPAVTGGTWGALDATGQAVFVAVFQSGWFVESMWSQTLAVHLMRTARRPFLDSRATAPLTVLGLAGIALATVLPFTPVASALSFTALPASYFALLAGVVVGYACVLALVKHLYVLRHGESL